MVLVKSFLQIIVFGKPCCVNTNLILTENFDEISIHTTMRCHMHLLYRIFPDLRFEWYLSSSWLMCPGLYFLLQEVDSWQTLAARSIQMMDHPPTHPVETLISTVVLPVLTFVWHHPQKFPCEWIALFLICLKETSSPHYCTLLYFTQSAIAVFTQCKRGVFKQVYYHGLWNDKDD